MVETIVMWAVGVLMVLAVGGDALKRKLTGTAPALTRWHLTWVIIAQAIVIASLFLPPVLALIRDAT